MDRWPAHCGGWFLPLWWLIPPSVVPAARVCVYFRVAFFVLLLSLPLIVSSCLSPAWPQPAALFPRLTRQSLSYPLLRRKNQSEDGRPKAVAYVDPWGSIMKTFQENPSGGQKNASSGSSSRRGSRVNYPVLSHNGSAVGDSHGRNGNRTANSSASAWCIVIGCRFLAFCALSDILPVFLSIQSEIREYKLWEGGGFDGDNCRSARS